MSIEQKYLSKILVASQVINDSRPFIVVGAKTGGDVYSNEYFVFHSHPSIPFLYRRTNYSSVHGEEALAGYPEVFSAEALLSKAEKEAYDRFGFEIRNNDRELYRDLFCSGTPLQLNESGMLPLIEFYIREQFKSEFGTMFGFSEIKGIRDIVRKLRELPSFNIIEQGNPSEC